MALHLRTDENGTAPVATHPAGRPGKRAAMACVVALGDGSLAAMAAKAASTSAVVVAPSGWMLLTSTIPSVKVPVLSMHSTSTRARPSTAGSSWTRTRPCASRTTAAAKAILSNSTSPSGTIATVPATAPETARRQPPSTWNWLQNSRIPVGTMTQETYFKIWLVPSRNSDLVRVNRRTCSARRTA